MKRLFYPCCGEKDNLYFLEEFIYEVDEFIFADLRFSSMSIQKVKNFLKGLPFVNREINVSIKGDFDMCKRIRGRREIEATYIYIDFEYKGIPKRVILRKGFGEFGLYELDDNSLDYFVHRGDGCGEGGSCVFFLGNRKRDCKALDHLLYRVFQKVKNGGYIISDGSNADHKQFKQVYRNIRKQQNRFELEIDDIKIENTILKPVGTLNYRYNHTIVWKKFQLPTTK